MEHDEIDLGVAPHEMRDPVGMSMALGTTSEEMIYPTFRYSGPVELDLPDDGKMEIEFCKISETSSKDPKTGKHHYECTIQVKKICEVEGDEEEVEPPARSGSEAADALDKLMKEREEENGDDGY